MSTPDYIKTIRQKVGHDLVMTTGVNAIVLNERGEVLLHRRTDNGAWTNPGGALEPGELPADGLAREVFEETGLIVRPMRITGVYSGPDYIFAYPNGDRVAIVSISFLCELIGGEIVPDPEESLEVRFFPPDALPPMEGRFRRRIRDALAGHAAAAFDFSG